jgi:tetratricopeptide (TPR) repeat protein
MLERARYWSAAAVVIALAPAFAGAQEEPEPAAEEPAAEPGMDVDEETTREARALFDLAHAHYDSGRYDEAAREFTRVHELLGRPELLYNIHLAYRDAGNVREAVNALRRYLAEAPTDDLPAGTRRMLERRLSAMESTLPPEPESGEPGEGEGTSSEGGAGEEATDDRTAHAPSSSEGLSAIPGGVVLGIGAAALLVAAIEGGVALATIGERDSMCTLGADSMMCPADYDQQAVVDRFTTHRDVAWGMFAAGLGIAAVGAVLLGVGLSDDRPMTASVACSDTGCGVLARGVF